MKTDLICGDSIKLMQQYKDKEFDLCLTDPPYNLGINYGLKVDDNKPYDKYLQFSKDWFKEAKRISRAVIFAPGVNNLKMWSTEIEYPKALLCWYNSNTVCRNQTGGGFIHWGPVLLYGNIRIGKDAFYHMCSIQRYKGSHPCPKPRNLYIDILKNCYWMEKKLKHTPEKVIDPFVGSGTTAMACKILDIDFVGIDIISKFIKEAKTNINNSMCGKLKGWL